MAKTPTRAATPRKQTPAKRATAASRAPSAKPQPRKAAATEQGTTMADDAHPGIDNVCMKGSYPVMALLAGLAISAVALWFGLWHH